jgi:hypothetical protein
MFPVIQVPNDAWDLPEPLGTKPKFWYRSQAGDSFLYKEGRPDSGEHWAERIACEICELLGVPHAEYELANWRGRKGVTSPNFVREGDRLILGNELIAKLVIQGYQSQAKRFQARQHSVKMVMGLLRSTWINPPIDFQMPATFESAADVFIGYLLIDALIGNQDRHHENWGLILSINAATKESKVFLAPSFDHASSLGRNERDEERMRRLQTRDMGSSVEHYVERARSAFFANPTAHRPLTTINAFVEATKIAKPGAEYWLQRLEAINDNMYQAIIDRVPAEEMSIPAREFALRILQVNQDRLLGINPRNGH